MSYFAKIENGKVTTVIVADQEFIDSSEGTWIETSYDTNRGVNSKGKSPLRKNYAGIGYEYNSSLDAFYPPKPFDSWNRDEKKGIWKSPVLRPNGLYEWDELNGVWK